MRRVSWARLWLIVALVCMGCSSSDGDDAAGLALLGGGEDLTWEEIATPLAATDGEGGQVSIGAPLVAFLPDGTMVVVEGDSDAEIEVACEMPRGSREFEVIATIEGTAGSWNYASFVEVYDSAEVIVGTGDRIYRVGLQSGAVGLLAETLNFDAVLAGDNLYFTWGTCDYTTWLYTGYVSSIDIDAASPQDTISDLVTGIPGASGGICLDDSGNIFTGNGYSNYDIDDQTGLIKAFSCASLPQAWVDGDNFADVLSAGSLTWLGEGIMLAGGGAGQDIDYFAALDATTGNVLGEFDPDPKEGSYYRLSANSQAGLLAAAVWDYTSSTGTIFLTALEAIDQ